MSPSLLNRPIMIAKGTIENIVNNYLDESNLFLVDITVGSDNEIVVTIDSANGVDINSCINLSQAIERALNRDVEDYSLTITSSGLDQTLRVAKQYAKFKGREVEVVFRKGKKLIATLSDYDGERVELTWSSLEKVEGKKRKTRVEHREWYPLDSIKTTKPFINFNNRI